MLNSYDSIMWPLGASMCFARHEFGSPGAQQSGPWGRMWLFLQYNTIQYNTILKLQAQSIE